MVQYVRYISYAESVYFMVIISIRLIQFALILFDETVNREKILFKSFVHGITKFYL